MKPIPVALQMFTVRDLAAKDFVGTVRKAAALGYVGIETNWPFDIPVKELKLVLDDLDLKLMATHCALPQLEGNLQTAIEDNAYIGNHYLVCPYMPEDRRRDLQGWQKTAETLNGIGEKVCAAGLELGYHNHAFEFQLFDGRPALDILYTLTDPKLLKAELDVYWIQYGGADPVAYMRKYGHRAPAIHLKDMDPSDRSFAEVGEGTVDMAGVMREAAAAGVVWFVVEQDHCKRPSIESARLSLENLRRQTGTPVLIREAIA